MLPPDEKMQCFKQSLPSDGREAPVIIYLSSLELTSASSVPSHTARDLHPLILASEVFSRIAKDSPRSGALLPAQSTDMSLTRGVTDNISSGPLRQSACDSGDWLSKLCCPAQAGRKHQAGSLSPALCLPSPSRIQHQKRSAKVCSVFVSRLLHVRHV